MYKEFVMSVDAIDNGISKYDVEIESKYSDSTNLSSRVHRLNPIWSLQNYDENV